jgi:hypothetical protein
VTGTAGDRQLRRIERDTLVAGGVMALGALWLWPSQPGRAAGVAGGLALIASSYQGIRAGVNAAWPPVPGPVAGHGAAGTAPSRSGFWFVKFFTRHAMLALGAYVMMARFEFDPVAMLAGVTAPAIAATVEFARTVRAKTRGSHSRLS